MSTKELTPEQEFEAAFAAATSEQDHTSPSEPELTEEPPTGEAEVVQQTDGQVEPSAEPEDPFAALPPAIRDELAKVTRLQHELEAQRRQVGQIGALQREIDRLSKLVQPREAPAAPKLEKVERLRQDLPEFAEALDEVTQLVTAQRQEQVAPPPQAEPEQPDVDPVVQEQMATLEELRPGWMDTFKSTDYLLWLGRQSPERQQEIRTTKRAAVILRSLNEFDSFAKGGTKQPPAAQLRQDRMTAAATPPSTGRRGQRAEPASEEADFLAGFKEVAGR